MQDCIEGTNGFLENLSGRDHKKLPIILSILPCPWSLALGKFVYFADVNNPPRNTQAQNTLRDPCLVEAT